MPFIEPDKKFPKTPEPFKINLLNIYYIDTHLPLSIVLFFSVDHRYMTKHNNPVIIYL